MSGTPQDKTSESIAKATSLADSLAADKAARLLADLPADSDPQGKVAPIRRALVERLNRLRPQRSRRLFTSLVEDLLVGETLGADDHTHVSYAFSRADLGGIWMALARLAFPDLARETAQLLERLCATRLIDEAMAQPEGAAQRERVRQHTIEHLSRLLGDRAACEHFLELANALRDREHARSTPLGTPSLPLMSRALLADLYEALVAAPVLEPALARQFPRLKAAPNAEGMGALLVSGTNELARDLKAAGLPMGAAEALPLGTLNCLAAYDGVAAYLRRRGLSGDRRVGEALVARFANHMRSLALTLNVAAQAVRREEIPLAFDPAAQAKLTELADHLVAQIGAIRQAGLLDAPILLATMRDAVVDSIGNHTRAALDRITQRFSAALNQRNHAAIDDADVRLSASLITRLRAALIPTGLPVGPLTSWRERAVADLDFALHRATRLEDAEDNLADRFRHLERIEDLAQTLGRSITDDLQPTSRHTQAIIAARLASPEPLSPGGARMCAGFVATIRSEIAKVRYWRNPELVALSDLAATRGL